MSLVSFVLILFGLFFLAPEGLQVIINNLVFSWAGLALLGVIVAVSLTWHFAGRNKVEVAQDIIKQRQKPLLLLLVVLFGLIGLFLAKGSAKDFLNDPSNSQRFWAWRAGIQNGLDHLWLGTGPSTVPYFLPTIRDKVPFDDWNDNNITGSLHNEPIDYFAASGAIGLIAYLLLWGSIFYFAVKGIRHVSENRRLILSLTVALAFFLGFNLFFFTVVNTMFLPWIAAAFILILSNNVSYTSCADSTVFKGWIRGLAYVLSGIFTLASLVFVSYWIADYYLGKGFKTNNSDYYKKAATLFPFNDAYLMRHSNANIVAMAQGIDVNDVSAVESMKPELESTIQLAQRAVDIRPLGHANWINYGAVSLFLEKVDDTYIGQADQHFQKALDLRPKSEIAHLEIAMSYWRAGDRDRAIDYAKKATALANKHTIGRCSGILGQYYYTDEQFDKALEAFKAAKDYLRGRDKQMVEEYIQELESKRENQI
ncbi:MAG: O-Antigen ligase [bacterium ADurb.Bin400]|nr:MAG: O-Antigen ligase [bacterium ADurb.Bin400]